MKKRNQFRPIAVIIAVLFSVCVNAQIKVYSTGKVYLGGTSTTPNSLLSVNAAGSSTYTGYFWNSQTVNGVDAIRAETTAPTSSSNTAVGAFGGINHSGVGKSIGTYGVSWNNNIQTGGYAIGAYGEARNANTGFNYGVVGNLTGSNNGAGIVGSVGFLYPSIPAQYAAYFDGQIRTTNDSPLKPSSGSWSQPSDVRLKTGIVPFKDGMSVIKQINPIKYKYNGIGGMPTAKFNYGVKAQDMQNIAPYTVGIVPIIVNQSEIGTFNVLKNLPADSSGNAKAVVEALSFNHDALIYVMINALKEHDSTIAALKNQLAACCPSPGKMNSGGTGNNSGNNGNPTETTYKVELGSDAILYQNEPNPFDGKTAIRFYIPDNVKGNAAMVFYDMYGKEIKKMEIKDRGFAHVDAETENLAVGIYSYSLQIDGKIIDTKKMVKQK